MSSAEVLCPGCDVAVAGDSAAPGKWLCSQKSAPGSVARASDPKTVEGCAAAVPLQVARAFLLGVVRPQRAMLPVPSLPHRGGTERPRAAESQERSSGSRCLWFPHLSRAGQERKTLHISPGGGLPRSALRLLVSCLPNIPHQPGDLKGRGAAVLVSLTDREPWDFPELICDKCNCRASLLREERDNKAKHKPCGSHLDLVLGRAGGSAAVLGTAPRCCLGLNKPGSVHPRGTFKPPQGRVGDPAVSLAPLDGAEQGGHGGSGTEQRAARSF